MQYISLGNPLWSCQLQILGGGRRLLTIALVYGGIFIGSALLWMRMQGGMSAGVVREILGLLAMVQVGVLLLGGPGAVHKALLRDHTTRMTDTLRTSPMSAWTVVAGYIIGGCLRMLTVFMVGALVGAGLIRLSGSGMTISSWFAGNLAALLVGVSVWSFVAFVGVGPGKPANVNALIVVLAVSSQLWLYFLPGLGLFTGAYAGLAAHSVMLNRMTIPGAFGLQLGVAAAMGAFWSFAAVRRYRKPWLPPLDPAAALVLVGLASFCCVASLMLYDSMLPGGWSIRLEDDGLFYVTVLAPLLFLHLPASMAVQGHRRLAFGGRVYRLRDRWPPTLWALLSAAVVTLAVLTLGLGAGVWHSRLSRFGIGSDAWAWAEVISAFVLAALFTAALHKLASFRTGRIGWATVAAVILWVAPPGLDVLRHVALQEAHLISGDRLSWFFGCSPIGTVLAAWPNQTESVPLLPGLAVQAAMVVIAYLLAHRAERALLQKRARLLALEADERLKSETDAALSAAG